MEKIIVGVILCGHDGRRGYIYHTAVNSDYRNKGVGKTLVEATLTEAKRIGFEDMKFKKLNGN